MNLMMKMGCNLVIDTPFPQISKVNHIYSYAQFNATSSPYKNSVFAKRSDETRIIKLRIGYKYSSTHEPCRHCDAPASPEHILVTCPFMTDSVKLLLRDLEIDNYDLQVQSQTIATQILLSSEDEQFFNLVNYLRDYYK